MSVEITRKYTCDCCGFEANALWHGWLRLSALRPDPDWGDDTSEYCPKCAKLAYAALKPLGGQ